MDKVEYGMKIEQLDRLCTAKSYEEAARVADTIEWRKVKKWSELNIAREAYEMAGRLKDARNICVYAYNRNLGGRRLVYMLAELSIALNDLEEADDLYKEFIDMAPHDMSRYILLYKLNKARGVPNARLIQILEEYRENEMDEQYGYELADLYAKDGRIEECVKECDDLILWFNDGEYVEKALNLKKIYAELTPSQKEKLQIMNEYRQAGRVYEPSLMKQEEAEAPKEDDSQKGTASDEMKEISSVDVDDIKIPVAEPSVYDTRNLQQELAKSMEIIMAGMKKEEPRFVEPPEPFVPEELPTQRVEMSEEIEEEPQEEPQEEQLEESQEEPQEESQEDIEVAQNEEEVIEEDVEDATEAVIEEVEETAEPETISEGYDTIISNEVSATAEPINVDVIEIQRSNVDDEVDEPTREIIINTHRWNQVKSVMEEIEEEVEAAKEEACITTEEQGSDKEEVKSVVTIEEVTPVQLELNLEREESVIEGQIDIMHYLEHMNDPEPAEEPAKEKDRFDEILREAVDNGDFDTEDADEAAAAIVRLTEKLISEVTEDYERKCRAEETTYVHEEIEDYEEEPQAEEEEENEKENVLADEPLTEETVEEEPDVDSDSVLNEAVKKYVKKYLFMEGMETAIIELLSGKKNEIPDGTSRHGNIIIKGKADTDKTGFAINIFKALHADDEQQELKIAKTTAEVLNNKGIMSSADKIKGTTLIIENADRLHANVVKELNSFMESDTGSMLVIFTGEEYYLKKIFRANPELRSKFDYKLELKHYTINELVEIAKEYARVKGYLIDEKALPELYISVGALSGDDEGSEIEKVKKIVDSAIIRNGKPARNFFGKKRKGLILLKEKHFI